jgi:NADH-quinone oxidoreductase subunit A
MLNAFYIEYFSIFVFLIISLVLAFIIFFLSYFVATQVGGTEKLSAYECGFEPFEDARNTFDVRFYVVALLFIIFDLEVTFFISLGSSFRKFRVFWFLDND